MRRMKASTKLLAVSGIVSLGLGVPAQPAMSATVTATATVSATLTSRTTLSLQRDTTSSVTRFSASQVVFDRYDDQDPGVTNPNSGFMYAPYRSEVLKNWHIARIFSNGTTMTLSATVTGTVGGQPIANRINVFCGGFFDSSLPTGSPPIDGTASEDWEALQGFSRTLSRGFAGVVPFNYRLNVSGVSAGTFTGSVTYTLIST